MVLVFLPQTSLASAFHTVVCARARAGRNGSPLPPRRMRATAPASAFDSAVMQPVADFKPDSCCTEGVPPEACCSRPGTTPPPSNSESVTKNVLLAELLQV
eukprot:CAMPEP_0119098240 /NCGR_PEP_ID=MMETSP1178-20130426/184489_1 /TAXON_ID=33656 /ORGANISM="unid sp, Strain CCMP2000" /LENGTH=100 /DNA_ID=CAMNT_0007082215 /DNA_START=43 /DNA_END=345 /DNA_ORIENTATION=+